MSAEAIGEDAALAARIAPVIADDGADEEDPSDPNAAAAVAAESEKDRWLKLKWAVWAAIVLAIAVFSRSALSSRPQPGSPSGSN